MPARRKSLLHRSTGCCPRYSLRACAEGTWLRHAVFACPRPAFILAATDLSALLRRLRAGRTLAEASGGPVVIFDCNGVLVDSEPLATTIVSQEFMRAGFPLTPDIVARYFTGRRPADMFAEVEIAVGRKLPVDFAATVTSATLRRFRAELRATKHAAYALSWLRGPKCVASSSSLDRIRVSLESTDLDPLLRAASVFGKRRALRQTRARPVPARGRQNARQSERMHRGGGFTGRRRRRRGGRHDGDRLCRRRPRRHPARQSSARGRRPRRDLRHARRTRSSI